MPNLIDRVRAAGRAAAAASVQETAEDAVTEMRKLRSRADRPPTYAGIGSRETPPTVLNQMAAIARTLRDEGWTLRTGGADGADTAFEAGTDRRQVEVFLPWPNFNGLTSPYARTLDPRLALEAERIAAQHHPAWERCRRGARKLHARNAAIVLGATLDDPVDAAVCWDTRRRDEGRHGHRYAHGRGARQARPEPGDNDAGDRPPGAAGRRPPPPADVYRRRDTMTRHLPDSRTTYVPLDMPPEDRRGRKLEAPWTGRTLVRVRAESVGTDPHGIPFGRRAPVDPERPTAAATNLWRELRPDEFPVPHLLIAVEQVSDEPGAAAFRGQRLGGDYAPLTGSASPDRWRGGSRGPTTIRIGGVLVGRRGGGWAIWRVLPGGPGAVPRGNRTGRRRGNRPRPGGRGHRPRPPRGVRRSRRAPRRPCGLGRGVEGDRALAPAHRDRGSEEPRAGGTPAGTARRQWTRRSDGSPRRGLNLEDGGRRGARVTHRGPDGPLPQEDCCRRCDDARDPQTDPQRR